MLGGAGEVTTCPSGCADNDWDIHMTDSWGDGWNGNTMTVTDCAGNVLESGITITAGGFGSADVCLDTSEVAITVSGGSWQSEISWVLEDAEGNVIISGGAPEQISNC